MCMFVCTCVHVCVHDFKSVSMAKLMFEYKSWSKCKSCSVEHNSYQEIISNENFSFQNTGQWEVRKIGSTNKETISETGDLRLFLESVYCTTPDCLLIKLSLYQQ